MTVRGEEVSRRVRRVRAIRRTTALEGVRSTDATRAAQLAYVKGEIDLGRLGERVRQRYNLAWTSGFARGVTLRPWDTGDPDQNWTGYLLPESTVLRNLVGATSHEELTDAEVDLSEFWSLELRENVGLAGPRTDDLSHICAPQVIACAAAHSSRR